MPTEAHQGTPFKVVNGVQVYLTPLGRYTAHLPQFTSQNEGWFTRPKFRDVEREILALGPQCVLCQQRPAGDGLRGLCRTCHELPF